VRQDAPLRRAAQTSSAARDASISHSASQGNQNSSTGNHHLCCEGVTDELPYSLSKISFRAFIAAAARCHVGYGSFAKPPNTMRRIAHSPAIKGGAYRCGQRWSGWEWWSRQSVLGNDCES